MNTTADNPATRIADVLAQVQQRANNTPNEPAVEGWKTILGAKTETSLLQVFAELRIQLAQVRQAVANFDHEEEDVPLLLQGIAAAEAVFDEVLSARSTHMRDFGQKISNETLTNLRFCAGALRRAGLREPVLNTDAISELLELVHELKDEITQAGLPPKVCLYLLRSLQEVETALDVAKATGYAGLEEALGSFMGASFRAWQETGKQQAETWWSRLWNKCQLVATGVTPVLGAAAKGTEFIHAIAPHVP